MKTANDYAKVSQEIGQIADKLRPAFEDAPYAEIRNLMIYHLRSAAGDARKIAEQLAEQERAVKNHGAA